MSSLKIRKAPSQCRLVRNPLRMALMTHSTQRFAFCAFAWLMLVPGFRAPVGAQDVPPERFVGTWVGVQRWAVDLPAPPAAQDNQPVDLTIEVVDGRLTGTMTPFMGGSDGATIVDTRILGDELHAEAVVGTPRPAEGATPGRRRRADWKDSVRIRFVFKLDDVHLTGTADVAMEATPWLRFTYALSKKRSRY